MDSIDAGACCSSLCFNTLQLSLWLHSHAVVQPFVLCFSSSDHKQQEETWDSFAWRKQQAACPLFRKSYAASPNRKQHKKAFIPPTDEVHYIHAASSVCNFGACVIGLCARMLSYSVNLDVSYHVISYCIVSYRIMSYHIILDCAVQ